MVPWWWLWRIVINKVMIEGPRVSIAVVRSTVWPAAGKRVGDTAVESQWMFVRTPQQCRCVFWYSLSDNCCSRGVRRPRVSAVLPMTSTAIDIRRRENDRRRSTRPSQSPPPPSPVYDCIKKLRQGAHTECADYRYFRWGTRMTTGRQLSSLPSSM
ncbi:hypothetical protein QTP88_021626 [Uroleucon formosanum]